MTGVSVGVLVAVAVIVDEVVVGDAVGVTILVLVAVGAVTEVTVTGPPRERTTGKKARA